MHIPLGGIEIPRRQLDQRQVEDGRGRLAPVIVGQGVYFGADDGFLYALDRTHGELLWKLSLGAPIHAAPVFASGRLYVQTTDGRLHAIE